MPTLVTSDDLDCNLVFEDSPAEVTKYLATLIRVKEPLVVSGERIGLIINLAAVCQLDLIDKVPTREERDDPENKVTIDLVIPPEFWTN